jgi:hypothetical protein
LTVRIRVTAPSIRRRGIRRARTARTIWRSAASWSDSGPEIHTMSAPAAIAWTAARGTWFAAVIAPAARSSVTAIPRKPSLPRRRSVVIAREREAGTTKSSGA